MLGRSRGGQVLWGQHWCPGSLGIPAGDTDMGLGHQEVGFGDAAVEGYEDGVCLWPSLGGGGGLGAGWRPHGGC